MITEVKKNLFTVDKEYALAHCISYDLAMGKGIAVEFQKKYNLREKIRPLLKDWPDCIFVNNVFNLITKQNYWKKPTYKTLVLALLKMKDIALENNIKKIAMPKIGCGLDRLQWGVVREHLDNIFFNEEILVCCL